MTADVGPVTVERRDVWLVALPRVGRKYVLVVSADRVNRVLPQALGVRITSVDRDRSLPTFAVLEPSTVDGLDDRSFVLCHEILLLPRRRDVFVRKVGYLPAGAMADVEITLSAALDL